jgi:excisionase family DNA binding protein
MHTVENAAGLLSISRTRMYQLIGNGDVFSVRIGRLRRIPDDALTAYMHQLTTA